MYLTQSLYRNLQQNPTGIATIYADRVRTVAESVDRISRLGAALAELGVSRGDRVGILALNSDRYSEYLFAAPWIGAAVNPVNIRWSVPEISYSLNESGTEVLLIDETFAPLLEPLRRQVPGLRTVIHLGEGEAPPDTLDFESLIAGSAPVEDTRTGGDELFGVFYTGGTTGRPKGVMLSHDNLTVSALGSMATGSIFTPRSRVLHAAPMFHVADISLWWEANIANATHVIIPVFNPVAVLEAIARHRVATTFLAPTMVQMLLDEPTLSHYDVSSLENFIYGASPISEAVLERARAHFPNAGFTQAYGMTELSPVATLLSVADHDVPRLRRSAGRAAPHNEVKIIGPDGIELPRGEIGEVVVRGDNVMLGYWNRPEDSAAATAGGWMRTGDSGRMDEEGYLFIVDRIKDMIVSGGENVYSTEVENALATHASVAACAVIGVPDDRWGERVHAVVVARPGAAQDADTLQEHCRALIASYKVPRSVSFVDELPISGAGKVLKRTLREEYWSAQPRQVG